jgi:hypothetical protein
MKVLKKSLSLNAAFLQEIKEDNRQLGDLWQGVLALLARPRRVSARLIVDKMWDLRDQLAMHFALEDAYGYFENAIGQAPRLSEQAELLRAQHDELFLEMCELVEEAEKLLYDETPARSRTEMAVRFYRFHALFQEHEIRENELIFEAFDDDIGVGD